jgi:hypothetical protein
VVVYTRVQTPRRWGEFCMAGDLDFVTSAWRPWRTSWLMVGIGNLFPFEATLNGYSPDFGWTWVTVLFLRAFDEPGSTWC